MGHGLRLLSVIFLAFLASPGVEGASFSQLLECMRSTMIGREAYQLDKKALAQAEKAAKEDTLSQDAQAQALRIMRARGWPIDTLSYGARASLERLVLHSLEEGNVPEEFQRAMPSFRAWQDTLANPDVAVSTKDELWTVVTQGMKDAKFTFIQGGGQIKDLRPAMPQILIDSIPPEKELARLSPRELLQSASSLLKEEDEKRASAFETLAHLDSLRAYEPQFKKYGFDSGGSTAPDDVFAGAQAAEKLLDQGIRLGDLDPSDRDLLREYAVAWREFEKTRYRGRNTILKKVRFKEPTHNVAARGTIDEFIRTEHYQYGWWRQVTLPGAKSRSPIRQLYGSDSERVISWAMDEHRWWDSTAVPDLNSFVLVKNRALDPSTGKMEDKSVETFVKTGGKWEPFFYVKRGRDWIPSDEFNGKPVPEACAECHMSNGVFSPTPYKKIPDLQALKQMGLYSAIAKTWSHHLNRTVKQFFSR